MSKPTVVVFLALAVVGVLAWMDVRSEMRQMRSEREFAVREVLDKRDEEFKAIMDRMDRMEATIQRIQHIGGETNGGK